MDHNCFYVISGGYKLELFDANGNILQTLTPEDGGSKGDGWMDTDTTAQSHLIKLPDDMKCLNCTVILNTFF
jgi:hypothetical protein